MARYTKKNDREREVLPFPRLDDVDVPAGCGFGRFGLIVRIGKRAMEKSRLK